MTDRNRTRSGAGLSTAGHYTDEDRTRSARIEEEFRIIRNEEVRRAESGGRLRTGVRKIGFQPNPS